MMTKRFSDLRYNLKIKWMWLQHTWTFNWAHRPLCDRFKSGVLQIGKLHLCRSCMFAYTGMIFGIIISITNAGFISQIKLIWLIFALAPVIFLSYPRFYKRFSRVIQDGLRLAMGIFIGISPFLLIYRNFLSGITVVGVMLVFWRIYFQQRQIRKQHACDNCPELNLPDICSGFEQQAAAIRLYEIEATDFMYRKNRGIPKEFVERTKL